MVSFFGQYPAILTSRFGYLRSNSFVLSRGDVPYHFVFNYMEIRVLLSLFSVVAMNTNAFRSSLLTKSAIYLCHFNLLFRHNFIVEAKIDPNNLAYTTGRLALHTDLPFYDYPPGVSDALAYHDTKQHRISFPFIGFHELFGRGGTFPFLVIIKGKGCFNYICICIYISINAYII